VNRIIRPDLEYSRLWFCLGLVLAAMIAVTCLLPARDLPAIGLSDKVKHGISYAVLAFWFASVVVRRYLLPLIAALVAFGGVIELAQELMQLGRTAELGDLLADMAGIGIGVVLAATPLGTWAYQTEFLFRRIRA
jgi:VanZ family protein